LPAVAENAFDSTHRIYKVIEDMRGNRRGLIGSVHRAIQRDMALE